MTRIEDEFKRARDVPRKKLSSPYNFKENMNWIKNNVFGPSKKYKDLTDFVPRVVTLNPITPKYSLGFIGDIMRMGESKLHFSQEVKSFFQPADYLIGNFEGTISDGARVFMSQKHSEKTLQDLKDLFHPERFILSCANNHSGDFLWHEYNKSYQMLKDHGFLAIGRKDEPSIRLKEQINIFSCTEWSNQPNTNYILYLNEIDKFLDPDARFNVLYPHWGYEMRLYPHPAQIEYGKGLLERWDTIMGHHSHCPQPIARYTLHDCVKLLAYSLGDFCIATNIASYHHGLVVRIGVGPGKDGKWQVGDVNWEFTRIHRVDRENVEVGIENKCKFFETI